MEDFVGDFDERQLGEEVEEYAARRDAMTTAVPQACAVRGSALASKTVKFERPGTKEMRKYASSRQKGGF